MATDIKTKIKYYEQRYFSNDEPVPFVGGLKIYPVLVKDYYKFYSVISCFTINKNEDNDGISMSNLEYLYYKMSDNANEGQGMISQFINLLEMIFHIEYGLKCPKCGKILSYDEVGGKIKQIKRDAGKDDNKAQIDINEYLTNIQICPECDVQRYETIRYEYDKKRCLLFIDDIKITKRDFDELRKIVCFQNMPDYDDDYIDPELKAELEEAARLRNPNNVQPSLEKQECCIISSTGYTFETIKNITIRKLVMLLRTIDSKLHYFAYRQAEASGMVSFKGELNHWIYGESKEDKFAHIQKLDDFKDKLKHVT